MLKVYGFSRVNEFAHGITRDLRVLWALEELGRPFELVGLDHPAGDTKDAAFTAVSPFAQIPVIDDDGVVVTESAAIALYLAKQAGALIPRDAAGEAQVVRWCFAAVNTVELPLLSLLLIDGTGGKDAASSAYRAFMVGVAHRLLGGLDAWLEGRDFVATEAFTVADIMMTHVLSAVKDETLLAAHPRVRAYRERCLARPAWTKVRAAYCARVEASDANLDAGADQGKRKGAR